MNLSHRIRVHNGGGIQLISKDMMQEGADVMDIPLRVYDGRYIKGNQSTLENSSLVTCCLNYSTWLSWVCEKI